MLLRLELPTTLRSIPTLWCRGHECGGNLPSGTVNGVPEVLDTRGLGETLLKLDVGSVIRILANTSEDAVKGIETSVTTSGCVLPEWFGW